MNTKPWPERFALCLVCSERIFLGKSFCTIHGSKFDEWLENNPQMKARELTIVSKTFAAIWKNNPLPIRNTTYPKRRVR